MDSFGRKIDYLRVSVTDRCNERCLYCMPEGYKGWAQTPDHLTGDEIVAVTEAAAKVGFRKFRITGGEPLIRGDAIEIIRRINRIPGVERVTLSTNALRLAEMAGELVEAGIRGVNISLDAIDPEVYGRLTGGRLDRVLEGIRVARDAGLSNIKLNCVLMRGLNDSQIWPLVRFGAAEGLPVRFIELMPLSSADVMGNPMFLSIGEARAILSAHDELLPLDEAIGDGPARYVRLKNSGCRVGFIGAMTNLHFCESCNKMRITADGKIRPCLGQHGEVDLIPALREGKGTLDGLFRRALRDKPLEHSFREDYQPSRPMTAIGG